MKLDLLLFFFVALNGVETRTTIGTTNERPIIGVLSHHPSHDADYSFIPATYIKYLESAGARVAPIICNSTTDQLNKLFKSINGVLFPGGEVSLNSSYYHTAAKVLFDLAVQAFDNDNDYFPIWGTCLGMQALCTIQQNSTEDVLSPFDSYNYTIPLNLTADIINESRLIQFYNESTLKWLTTEPLTMNLHNYGVDPEKFIEDFKLRSFYQVVSTNFDRKGKEFVSTIEAFQYPIYGSQWHPEKNQFDWNPKQVTKHSYHAVEIGQTAANFFVEESRKNGHHFSSQEEERDSLIYNYNPVLTSTDEQMYHFPCC